MTSLPTSSASSASSFAGRPERLLPTITAIPKNGFQKPGECVPTLGRKAAMNVEQLDGFLVALICCPSDVAKSDYLPEIRSHIRNQHYPLWAFGRTAIFA